MELESQSLIMQNNIVFCIWLGSKIPDKFLHRLNCTMTDLYITYTKTKPKHKPKSYPTFILYTNNPAKIMRQIVTDYDNASFLMKKLLIKPVDSLFSKYDEMVTTARKNFQDMDYSNTTCYPITITNADSIPVRKNHLAWSKLYSSYLYFLYMKQGFQARVALNLRLIALAIHGGLYFDMDVMSSRYANFLTFQKTIQTYIQCKQDIARYNSTLNHKTYNDLMKFIKKIAQKHNIHLADVISNQEKEKEKDKPITSYTKSFQDYIPLLETYLTNSIVKNAYTQFHITSDMEHYQTQSPGIFAITNYITKMNHNAAFSQNILMVQDIQSQKTLCDASIHSLMFNMKLSSFEPNTWSLVKNTDGYQIINDPTLGYNVELPLDIFLSRKKFPYVISKETATATTTTLEITYRTGRPLHPLGQIATRGCWNFIVNKLSRMQTRNITLPNEVFHMKINGITLLPESAVIDEKQLSVHGNTHWTKAKNHYNTL